MQGATNSQDFSVGSFFSWLPKIVAAWPAAGNSSNSPTAAQPRANAVGRLIEFDIPTPLEVSILQPWTIVKVGPLRDDPLPAASRAATTTL